MFKQYEPTKKKMPQLQLPNFCPSKFFGGKIFKKHIEYSIKPPPI
jgi:hypothetical protein